MNFKLLSTRIMAALILAVSTSKAKEAPQQKDPNVQLEQYKGNESITEVFNSVGAIALKFTKPVTLLDKTNGTYNMDIQVGNNFSCYISAPANLTDKAKIKITPHTLWTSTGIIDHFSSKVFKTKLKNPKGQSIDLTCGLDSSKNPVEEFNYPNGYKDVANEKLCRRRGGVPREELRFSFLSSSGLQTGHCDYKDLNYNKMKDVFNNHGIEIDLKKASDTDDTFILSEESTEPQNA